MPSPDDFSTPAQVSGPPPGTPADFIDMPEMMRWTASHGNDSRKQLQGMLAYLAQFKENLITGADGQVHRVLSLRSGSTDVAASRSSAFQVALAATEDNPKRITVAAGVFTTVDWGEATLVDGVDGVDDVMTAPAIGGGNRYIVDATELASADIGDYIMHRHTYTDNGATTRYELSSGGIPGLVATSDSSFSSVADTYDIPLAIITDLGDGVRGVTQLCNGYCIPFSEAMSD